MDMAWITPLDELLRSPTLPMWLALAATVVFAILFLIILLRADRSVANGTLAVMTLLAVGAAAVFALRGPDGRAEGGSVPRATAGSVATLPALSCIDDLAGDSVEAGCEKALFGAPDHVAAAVSYAAARLGRLTALGDVATADRVMTPELRALRRSIERDRYGLAAHVLASRDGCTATSCAAFRALTDHSRIAANIDQRVYHNLVERYAPTWSGGAPPASPVAGAGLPPAAAAAAAVTGEPASAPTGRPNNVDFPSSSSIPPVSIMNTEPAAPAASAQRPAAAAKAPPAASKAPAAQHQAAPAKRRANPPPRQDSGAPVQLAPAAPANNGR